MIRNIRWAILSVFKIGVARLWAVLGEIETKRRGTALGVLADQSRFLSQRLGVGRTGRYDRGVNMCVTNDSVFRTYQ